MQRLWSVSWQFATYCHRFTVDFIENILFGINNKTSSRSQHCRHYRHCNRYIEQAVNMELNGRITVYSIVGCPHCMKAKSTLSENQLPYTDISVDRLVKFWSVGPWSGGVSNQLLWHGQLFTTH